MKFFGSSRLPLPDVSLASLRELAMKGIRKREAIPGVQPKMSLALSRSRKEGIRLTLTDYPSGYILKPQSPLYPQLPETEHLVMSMAESWRIPVVPYALLPLSDGSLAYITRRIDREKSGKKLPMEDFCQLAGKLTEDKYHGSCELCGKIIAGYSSRPGLDEVEFFQRILFCFITGNNDMHLKNFSLIEDDTGWHLSPQYDLLPVSLVNPADADETALTIAGKRSRLKKGDFLSLASSLGIPLSVASRLVVRAAGQAESLQAMIGESLLETPLKEAFHVLVLDRCRRLSSDA